MKLMVIKKTGERKWMSDGKARLLMKAGAAFEDFEPVVKEPIPDAEPEETEPQKPKSRRRYKRRDMAAEETTCFQESKDY